MVLCGGGHAGIPVDVKTYLFITIKLYSIPDKKIKKCNFVGYNVALI